MRPNAKFEPNPAADPLASLDYEVANHLLLFKVWGRCRLALCGCVSGMDFPHAIFELMGSV